ncbi:hypothetical protein ACFL2V_21845 [Pseudomonadota bacterium]
MKLNDNPIEKEDIEEYLRGYSDFAFEIKVMNKLSSLGFVTEHAGTYEDPISRKTREFDIRARKRLVDKPSLKLDIRLSIECKNLRDNFPLVIHCMPREENECYLELVWASKNLNLHPYWEHSSPVRLEDDDCLYRQLDPVGKACDQVGRKANSQSPEIVGNDGDVFDKISQAINSGYDLLTSAHYLATKESDVVTIVVPVLVVADNRLWTVWYNRTGEIEQEPTKEKNVEYYIDKSWLIGDPNEESQVEYSMSHLEIVEIRALAELIEKYISMSALDSARYLMSRKHDYFERWE